MAQFCPLTGRGVIVDVIANPEMTSANLAPIIGGARLSDYDAVVTTVGINDALAITIAVPNGEG